jgi:hypothetical protein
MIEPILACVADFKAVYLIGDGMLLALLFLWNIKLIKIIAKWTLPLATMAVVFTLLNGSVDGGRERQGERESLVPAHYYLDPTAGVPTLAESEQ